MTAAADALALADRVMEAHARALEASSPEEAILASTEVARDLNAIVSIANRVDGLKEALGDAIMWARQPLIPQEPFQQFVDHAKKLIEEE